MACSRVTMLPLLSLLLLSGCAQCMVRVSTDCAGDGSIVPACKDHEASVPEGVSFFLPHEYNCSRFWECSPDLLICLFECAPISDTELLYFDYTKPPEMGDCDWPYNVDCTMGSASTTTTTTTTTTTPTTATTTTPTTTPATTPTTTPTSTPITTPTTTP